MAIKLYADGASRGNPGHASCGFWIEKDGEIFSEGRQYLGIATNNVAEWTGLLLGIKSAKEAKFFDLEVCMDSELVIKQITGLYKVKNEGLLPIFQAVKQELPFFKSIKFSHIRREFNKKADMLANKAIDEYLR